MNRDRFAYDSNIRRATRYRGWRNALWPPALEYRLFCLALSRALPAVPPSLATELDALRRLIDSDWHANSWFGAESKSRLRSADAIAQHMRRIAELLPFDDDRRAMYLRADAVERGYDERALSTLAEIDEHIAIVAGHISTWHGKQPGGLPTAFACVQDAPRRAAVAAARARTDDIATYLRRMHADLRLGSIPAFAATQLFFMAGEGNRHPKHIAYFLPEDEGVKRSPYKKTYYFANTHEALLRAISLPHARRFVDLGQPTLLDTRSLEIIPTLGVFAHEVGHAVHRGGATFAALNAADRWTSIALQETAADVFGLLILAEVLAPALAITVTDAVAYHLAECLRYVDRGLGIFPDSDGMFLQLNYLAAFGALSITSDAGVRLVGDPEVIIAGFRSLARVLADTLLAADVSRTVALFRNYGPASADGLSALIDELAAAPQKTLEYIQEATPSEVDSGPPLSWTH